MFEVREMVVTHWVALDAIHATLSEPWADAVATNEVAPMVALTATATKKREERRCHVERAVWLSSPSSVFVIFKVLMVTSRKRPVVGALEERCHTLNESAKGDSPSALCRASTPTEVRFLVRDFGRTL
jgi:hypothetical protein